MVLAGPTCDGVKLAEPVQDAPQLKFSLNGDESGKMVINRTSSPLPAVALIVTDTCDVVKSCVSPNDIGSGVPWMTGTARAHHNCYTEDSAMRTPT